MNKEMKRAVSMIEEKRKFKTETINKSKQAIQEKKAKLDILNESLAKATTEEDYTAICREIRDTESAIEFHTKRMNYAETHGVLTEAEEKEIRAQLDKAHDSINAETAGEIQATVSKLFTLIACRVSNYEELNGIVSQLKSVNAAANMPFYNPGNYPQHDRHVTECTNLYHRMVRLELAEKGLIGAGEVKL